MAQAVVEERQLLKTLRWYDGFALALANPGFLLGSLGYSVFDLGGWGAAMLWGITAFLIVFVMVLYSELAAMFPHKSGGFPLYANEGWRKYTTLVGPIATFGYWLGWSVVLAFLGLFVGSIAQARVVAKREVGHERLRRRRDRRRLFQHPARQRPHRAPAPDRDRSHPLRLVSRTSSGRASPSRSTTWPGLLFMIPLFVFMVLPFLNGDFDSANLTYKLDDPGLAWGGLQMALVWIWLMIWSAGGVDTCATFAPEYKDTVRDTRKALLSASIFSLIVYTILPIGLVGGVGAETVEAYDYVGALNQLVGTERDELLRRRHPGELRHLDEHGDGGREPRPLRHLEGRPHDQAARDGSTGGTSQGFAMSIDTVLNILFVLFIGNIFGILAASNIGYVLAHVFALSAFILLRRDRPNWPRPIKLANYWTLDRRRPLRHVHRLLRSSASAGSRSPPAATARARR